MEKARTRALPALLATASLMIAASCGKSGSPAAPSPAGALVPIRATVIADYTLGQGRAQGEVVFRCVSPPLTTGAQFRPLASVQSGRLGEPVDLGSFPAGMALSFDIEIRGEGALKRIFRNVPLAGDVVLTTDILRLDDFDWAGFWHPAVGDPLIGPSHKNQRLNVRDLVVQFPGHFFTDNGGYWCGFGGHGAIWMKACWSAIQAASAGFIRSITYMDRIERLPSDPVFAGDILVLSSWCAAIIGLSGQVYSFPDGSINSMILTVWGDQSETSHQLVDSLFPGSQAGLWGRWDVVGFLFRRPAGDESNYRIYESHEEQDGFSGAIQAR